MSDFVPELGQRVTVADYMFGPFMTWLGHGTYVGKTEDGKRIINYDYCLLGEGPLDPVQREVIEDSAEIHPYNGKTNDEDEN